ncbi:DNA/RNA nuclease SfsA [Marinobacterium jannaschii]|uniref:DNA/RNA nuclease SfsA n=1 Tax=Marinobacterium jannaschii TaxID=64970 RepID=UPI000569CAA8|nr:DNA/RNA nuclease SfsA [Marinobacterium jannaschii]
MLLQDLIEGRLVRRYKRFLADVELADGELVTAHCPNTGSMKNCAEPGSRVWLSRSDNPKRKYPLSWELVEIQGRHRCCINTGRANALVREAIEQGVISELQGYDRIRQEVKYGENSRIDLLLQHEGKADTYIEVKNLTLLNEGDEGSFPDAVTARGTKHLNELMAMVAEGHRAVMLFCVPHEGIGRARPADEIDPLYGQTLRQAVREGVEVLAYRAAFEDGAVYLRDRLPVDLST